MPAFEELLDDQPPLELPTDIVEEYLIATLEPQSQEQQEQPSEQPQQQPQPGPSQLQPPVAAVMPKTLTVQDKINRQIKTEQLVCNPSFKGHPKYDMSLNYKLQNHANLYKLINLGIDKQILSIPFFLLTANLESSEDSYIRNLEQSFLRKRYKNFQLQQRNDSLLRELRDYRNGDFRDPENFSNL